MKIWLPLISFHSFKIPAFTFALAKLKVETERDLHRIKNEIPQRNLWYKHQWTLSNYKLSREKCYLHTVKIQYFIREGECFIRVSKHEKADESTRPKAECFCCFRVFENPDETWSSSLWNGSSKGPTLLTINTKTERPRKYSVFVLFCFIVACAWLLVSVMKDVVFFHNFGF